MADLETLTKQFDQAMRNLYQESLRAINYRPNLMMQMVSQEGGLAAARKLLATNGSSSGLTTLWDKSRLDLSVEALILKPEFASLFSEEERRKARQILKDYSYTAPWDRPATPSTENEKGSSDYRPGVSLIDQLANAVDDTSGEKAQVNPLPGNNTIGTSNATSGVTGVQAGLSGKDQILIALKVMANNNGSATMQQIYNGVEAAMGGRKLSAAGKASLRYFINTVAVDAGYVYPYNKNSPGWKITEEGRKIINQSSPDVVIIDDSELTRLAGSSEETLIEDEPEPDESEPVEYKSLLQWQTTIKTSPEEIKPLVKEYPDWLNQNFEGRVKFTGYSRQRFGVWIEGVLIHRGRFNLTDGLYVRFPRLQAEELPLLKNGLSRPESLQPVPRLGPAAYRFIIYNRSDYRLLQELVRRMIEQADTERSNVTSTQQNWIFQSNPQLFDLSGALAELNELTWLTNQHADNIRVGDTVYLWESGNEAGVVAIARILTNPAVIEEDSGERRFNLDQTPFEGPKRRVRLKIERVLPQRVTRQMLLKDPVLKDYSFLRAPQGTNFKLSSEQAKALADLITSTSVTSVRPNSSLEDKVKETFAVIKQNRYFNFEVKIRGVRAEQLRQLLSNPNGVDLATFNREVWLFESSTRLNGQEIKGQLFSRMSLSRLGELEQALETGQLELHGNYIWGTASQIYGPTLAAKDTETTFRTRYIREALSTLNNAQITPLEKARQIDEIYGFGENIATGLVMVFHPTEFALYNQQSKPALEKLGFQVDTLERFEEAAGELRQVLGAEDFIELDWFLYLLKNGSQWEEAPESLQELRRLLGLASTASASPLEISADNGEVEPEGQEPGGKGSATLEDWQNRIKATTRNEVVGQLVDLFPEWLKSTFGNRVEFFPGTGSALEVWIDREWCLTGYFNTVRPLFIHIRGLTTEDVKLLQQSGRNNVRSGPGWSQGWDFPVHSVWIISLHDYALLQEVLERRSWYNLTALTRLINRFKTHFTDFNSQKYLDTERNYKLTILERVHSISGPDIVQGLLNQNKYEEARKAMIEVYRGNPEDNLLNRVFHTRPYREAPAEPLTRTFKDLLYGEGEFNVRFEAWLTVLKQSLPRCWPAATYYLMFRDPDKYLFIRPEVTSAFLSELKAKLKWNVNPNAEYYNQLLELARRLLVELRDLGARDMIDVQSFIWIVEDEAIIMLDSAYQILKETNGGSLSLQEILQRGQEKKLFKNNLSSLTLNSALLDDDRFFPLGEGKWMLSKVEKEEKELPPPVSVLPRSWDDLTTYWQFIKTLDQNEYTAEELFSRARQFNPPLNQYVDAKELATNLCRFRLLQRKQGGTGYSVPDYLSGNRQDINEQAILRLMALGLLIPVKDKPDTFELAYRYFDFLHYGQGSRDGLPYAFVFNISDDDGLKIKDWLSEAGFIVRYQSGDGVDYNDSPGALLSLSGEDAATQIYNRVLQAVLDDLDNQTGHNKNLPLKALPLEELETRLRELAKDLLIDTGVVRRIYRSLVAGRHVVLSGPPGTGKTELAKRLPELLWRETLEVDQLTTTLEEPPVRAVALQRNGYKPVVVTATEDWGVRNVVGGIAPKLSKDGSGQKLSYDIKHGHLTQTVLKNYPGLQQVALSPELLPAKRGDYSEDHSLYNGAWLVIDEFTRAPVDAAFGSLLTTLGSTSGAILSVPTAESEVALPLPLDFRIIGTLNSFDRHFLNQISEAMKRRFDFIDVLPPAPGYALYEQGITIKNALQKLYQNGFKKEIELDEEQKRYTWKNVLEVRLAIAPDGIERPVASHLDDSAKAALTSFWRIFEAIRLFRQLGTAQAEAVYLNLFAGKLVAGMDWAEALDTALADALADQLQVLNRDEQKIISAYLEYAHSDQAFLDELKAIISGQPASRRPVILRSLQMAHQLRHPGSGETIRTGENDHKLLGLEQIKQLFNTGENLLLPPVSSSVFYSRLYSLMNERGL